MAADRALLHQILENAQVRLIDAGDKCCGADWTQIDNLFPYDSIGYIREGEVSLTVNGRVSVMQPGALYYIPAMNRFSHYAVQGFARVYWTHFVLGPKDLELSHRLEFPVSVEPPCPQETETLFAALLAARKDPSPGGALLRNSLMGQLAAQFLALGQESLRMRPTERFDEMQRTAEYIRENLDKELSVELLAARVGLNPHYFIRVFQHFFHETPLHFVLRQREETARRLLECSSLSVKEIGLSLGFSNQNYFSAFFKKRSGCSPSAYRALKGGSPQASSHEDLQKPQKTT